CAGANGSVIFTKRTTRDEVEYPRGSTNANFGWRHAIGRGIFGGKFGGSPPMRVRLHRRATHPVHPFMITATVTATVSLLLVALIFGGTFPAATAFAHSYEYAVRAYGMGGAFTAVAD